MKDRSLNNRVNRRFIALTAMAIHHCLSGLKTGQFRVPPEFDPGDGAQCQCNRRNINQTVNIACTDVFRHLDTDFCSSLPVVQPKKTCSIPSMICRKIHLTGTDPVMAKPHNHQLSSDEDFLDYLPEELLQQPDNSFNHLTSPVVATEARMPFSAVLPMGWSAIASSSQPVPCSNSNSNRYNIANITSIENTGSVDGSMIEDGAMTFGG